MKSFSTPSLTLPHQGGGNLSFGGQCPPYIYLRSTTVTPGLTSPWMAFTMV